MKKVDVTTMRQEIQTAHETYERLLSMIRAKFRFPALVAKMDPKHIEAGQACLAFGESTIAAGKRLLEALSNFETLQEKATEAFALLNKLESQLQSEMLKK